MSKSFSDLLWEATQDINRQIHDIEEQAGMRALAVMYKSDGEVLKWIVCFNEKNIEDGKAEGYLMMGWRK